MTFLETKNLSAQFDSQTGFLRRIHFQGVEILRGIYGAVRDHNWDTIEPQLSDLNVSNDQDRFRITFTASCHQRGVEFSWQGHIQADDNGQVTYKFCGISHSAFRRNRIGLCLLHPPMCAGSPCEIEHCDGSKSITCFPDFISPHQPFLNLRSIRHTAAQNIEAEVRMEGDTFEMEDQRNWTDASFKTYCTPLGELFPVDVQAGLSVNQTVTLSIQRIGVEKKGSTKARQRATRRSDRVTIAIDREASPLPVPAIGLGYSTKRHRTSERQQQLLRMLAPAHLRVDLRFSESGAAAKLQAAAADARSLSTELEVAMLLSDRAEEELQQVVKYASQYDVPVARWLIYHSQEKSTDVRWIRLARQVLHELAPQAPIVSGTNAYFTELNRERPARELLDAVCYSINPQVHAFDDASLMETLSMQSETVRSTRCFLPDLPIAITPVTLRPRFNPNATGIEPKPERGELPAQVDPRQPTCFAAAWTLASLKYLCESGVDSITYYETVGWRGVMETEAGSAIPGNFPSTPGAVFPLFHVLTDVSEWGDAKIQSCHSSDPLGAVGLFLRKRQRKRLMIGNLRGQTTTVGVGLTKGAWSARALNDSTKRQATVDPVVFRDGKHARYDVTDQSLQLTLLPYEVVTLDHQSP